MHDCKSQPDDATLTALNSEGDDELHAFETLDAQTRDLIDRSLQLLVPVEPQPHASGPVLSGYDAFIHADLCRMVLLGLSRSSAARACGISPSTLSIWLKRTPKLALDMDSAAGLSTAHVALLLRNMMTGRDTVAFNAVKFYLSTHAPEFKERTVVEVDNTDPTDVMRQIRQRMYGLNGDLPMVDVEPPPSDVVPTAPSVSIEDTRSDVAVTDDPLDFDL